MIIGAVSLGHISNDLYSPKPGTQFRTINNDHDRIELRNWKTRPRYIDQRHRAYAEGMKLLPQLYTF